MAQHFIHILGGQLLIGTAVEQNAVLGVLVDLNDSMAGRTVHDLDELIVHTVLLAGIQEHLTILADQAAVVDLHACLCQSAGLIHALAAQEGVAGTGSLSLTGQNDVVHGVDIVNIQRTDI